MQKLFIIEVIIYILGFILCVSSIFSSELFNLSSANFKSNNVKGISIGVYGGCIHFVNGTNNCFLYSCTNSTDLTDFCEDIKACRFGLFISALALLIMCIMSLIRCVLICCNVVGQEGICTIINLIFGMVAIIGTSLGAGSGAQASIDFLNIYPPGLVISTLGSGYTMIIVALICSLLCIILQCGPCCNRYSRNNQTQIIYQYIPQPTESQYNNPLFHNNINPQPPPTYTSKAGF